MKLNHPEDPKAKEPQHKPFLPRWFVIWAGILVALVVLKSLGLQIYIEFEYDGEPFTAGLTELETYLIPLGLIGVYFLCCWLWDKVFGSRNSTE